MARVAVLALLAALAVVPAASARMDTASRPSTSLRPEPADTFLVAHVRGSAPVPVHNRPFGRVLGRLSARTDFGSRRAFAVVRSRRDRWLAVPAPELGNGRLGWIDAGSASLRFTRTPIELRIDLSRRELVVREGGRALRRLRVGIGAPGTSTPTGRFAVTDLLPGARFNVAYGCCILALSGRQPNLPPGWPGGDRLAIHGTPDGSRIGGAASNGCLEAAESDLRYLMRRVPLGTQVVIHP